MTIDRQLERGLAALGLELQPDAPERLRAFADLLEKWNRVYNLTAHSDPSQLATRHLLDSLAVLPHLDATNVADIGSGCGMPGIPLAIACPGLPVTLVEASHKKATFLRQAKIELGLNNVAIANERVERLEPREKFASVISRALSDIADFVQLTQHAVAHDGRWYAMKGVMPHDELNQLPAGYRVAKIVVLDVPGVAAARHLIIIERI